MPNVTKIAQDAHDSVARARAFAGAEPWLVGYDVNGIQEYITANSRPTAMRGASKLILDFDKTQATHPGVLFAGGGRGLFLVPRTVADAMCVSLPKDYANATVSGVLSIAAAPWNAKQALASLRWLELRLQNAKDSAVRPRDELPTSKETQCQRCRRYQGRHKSPVGNETELLCTRCDKITEAGKKAAREAEQYGSLTELSSKSGYIAALSADGNKMGALFDELDTLEALAATSVAIGDLFQEAHQKALKEARAEHFIAPITGGDDIRVFFAPQHVEPYVRTLSAEIERGAAALGNLGGLLNASQATKVRAIGVGIGVVAAGDKSSASSLLQRAHDLERSAKLRCLKGTRSAVDFRWLNTGDVYLDGSTATHANDLKAIPLDTATWTAFVNTVKALEKVPRSQLTLVAERKTMGDEEFANLFRYQVARSKPWQEWYSASGHDWRDAQQVINRLPNASMLEFLRMMGDA